MQKYKEINGNDYVKNSRTTINETMQSIQSMNSGTAFPTNNLFEGMKCYRTDLKKTYTLTDVENGTWVEDAHATLADTATKLQTPRTLSLTGKAAGSATFDGSANASINVTSVNADTAVADSNGVNIAANYVKKSVRLTTENLNDIHTPGLYFCDMDVNATTARNYPTGKASAVIVTKDGANGDDSCTQLCMPYLENSIYKRQYEPVSSKWSTWRSVAFTDSNVASASKLAAARTISLTGNASGSATFDGTSDVSINTTVNESKHAVNADVAKTLETTSSDGIKRNAQFYWIGQGGQPDWLWGASDTDVTSYPYKPSNFHVAAANNDGNGENIANTYLKKSGGNMNGPLNFANGTWNLVGDNSYIGDHDIGGTFCVKGANGETGIALVNTGNESDYAHISYGGGNINFNKKIGGNLAGNADTSTKASVADVVHKAIQPCGTWSNENYIFYGTLTIPQSGTFFKLEVLGGSGHNSNVDQSREGTLYFRTGNNSPAHYAAYSEYHRNGADDFKFFVVKDSGTRYRIYSGLTFWTGNIQVIPYITQESSFDLALTTVSALPDGAVEVEQQQLIYASTVNNYAPTKTGGGASGTWGINISGNAASATNADKLDGYHASDIINRISAANTGGIVAASLTENGYVKFANGLILQWGNASGEGDENVDNSTTFPIAFPSTCFTVLLTSKISLTGIRIVSQSKTSFTWKSRGGLISWIALGM